MDNQETIISFLKLTGPVLPSQVAKHINTNILLASAHLSELTSQGKVKVSNLKIGGSPIYYLPEHKNKLHNFSQHLNPKDHQTFELLKEEKILQEKNLSLINRVSLRNIKDFAIPLNVTLNNDKELFWKWYLIGDQEATELIRTRLSVPKEELGQKQLTPVSESIPKSISDSVGEEIVSPKKEIKRKPRTKKPKTKKIVEKEELEQDELGSSVQKGKKSLLEEEKSIIQEKDKESIEEKEIIEKESPLEEKLTKQKEQEETNLVPKKDKQKDLKNSRKKPLFQKIKDRFKPKRVKIPDEFFPMLDKYFQERTIKIDKKEMIRKNSEMNFILKVPAVVGELTYYCKAKNKKRCDEKDLSAAYLEAQTKKFPLLFLYTNELTKKAQDMIDSGNFDNMTAKKIE
ncbi:hypothetical protein ACFL0E_00770 [Nanoarchaeota archaeon]